MNDDCISDLAIDRYLAEVLTAQRRSALESHAETCARCGERLSVLRNDAASLRESLPALPQAQRSGFGWPVWIAVAAGLLLAVALGRRWPGSEAESVDTDRAVAVTRTKGRAQLTTYLRRDARVRVFDGETVRAGDELAFAYTSSADVHLALFDVDGGRVTAVFPAGEQTFAAEAGVGIDLDVAVALDGSPREEAIVAVFCDEPQPIRALREVVASGSAPPSGCHLSTTALPKEAG